MEVSVDFHPRVEVIEWLRHCGESSRPSFDFPFLVRWVEDRTIALESMFSTQWADATTVAQGRLTGCLAKMDYDTYGATWNSLFKQSQAIFELAVGNNLSDALEVGAWPTSLTRAVLPELTLAARASIGKRMSELREAQEWHQCLFTKIAVDVNRAAMEMTYRRRFPKVPVFFELLLQVYESGRLPCGWEGDIEYWPEGKLIVY